MKAENRNKIVILAVFTALLTFNAAAQVNSSGPVEFLNDIATSISDSDQLEWLEADTFEEILIFLGVPILAFYAITRLIVTKGIEYAETNFRENSSDPLGSSGEGLSDMGDWTARMLSIGVSTVAVVQYGGLFYNLTAIFGLAIVAGIFWVFVSGSRGIFDPNPFGIVSRLFGGNGDNNSTGYGQGNGNPEEEMEGAEEAAAAVNQEEDEVEQEVNEAESDAGSGNTAQADAEAEQAADDEQEALEDLELGIQHVRNLMEIEEGQLRNTIEELDHTREEEVYEQNVIEKLKQDLDTLNSEVSGNIQKFENNTSREELRNVFPPMYIVDEFPKKVNTGLDESAKLVEKLEKAVTEERKDLQNEDGEIKEELKELVEVKKLLKRFKQEVNKGESIDAELEKLAKKLSDESLYKESVTEVEEEEKKIEEQLRGLFGMEDEIEKALKKEYELLRKIEEIDEKEISELNNEDKELRTLRENLMELHDLIKYDLFGADSKSAGTDFNNGPCAYRIFPEGHDPEKDLTEKEARTTLNQYSSMLNDEDGAIRRIVSALGNLEEAKTENSEEEKQLMSNIEKALNQ